MAAAVPCIRLLLLAITSLSRLATAKHDSFCGMTWADASSNCDSGQPCPEGTDDECSGGKVCFGETMCSTLKDDAFCGTSWADASSNCDDRQPCPGGMADECEEAGHVCFGSTECSVAAGDGAKFKYLRLGDMEGVEHGEMRNSRFCGLYPPTGKACTVETHCPSGGGCPEGEYCYITTCNVQDLLEAELGEDWLAVLASYRDGGNGEVEEEAGPVKMDPRDPRRHNYCGADWGGASRACDRWCEHDAMCPGGQNCYAKTTCYYDEDLQPTLAPIVTSSPTRSPLGVDDPASQQFCGSSWALATQSCSYETHCYSDKDCIKGQRCHHFVPGCNLATMQHPPIRTSSPTRSPLAIPSPDSLSEDSHDSPQSLEDQSSPIITSSPTGSPLAFDNHANPSFCGSSWALAIQNCSYETRCNGDDEDCNQQGHRCYSSLPGCSLVNMPRPLSDQSQEKRPRDPPHGLTGDWIDDPNDGRNFQFCGSGWDDAAINCNLERHCPDFTCSDPELVCFMHLSSYDGAQFCNAYDMIRGNTRKPTLKPSVTPTEAPTQVPTTEPTLSPSERPTGQPTNLPTTQPTAAPTMSPVEIVHGLCARSYEDLQGTYRFAQKCTNLDPCGDGQICYPNIDASYFIQLQTSPPSKSPQTNSPSKTPSKLPTMFPVAPTPAPMHEAVTPYPTYTHAPSVSKSVQPIASRSISQQPTAQKKTSALAVNTSKKKPIASSIQNNKNQPKPDSKAENYVPDLCPLDFVGLRSPEGECKTYYDCKNGLLSATHMCPLGQLFDNKRGKCGDQRFVDNKCQPVSMGKGHEQHESDDGNNVTPKPILVVENEHQLDVIEEETFLVYSPDLCPLGFIGLHSLQGDCQEYFDCNDGFLQKSYVCGAGLKFDNGAGRCISQRLVDSKCTFFALETSNDPDPATDAPKGSDNMHLSTKVESSEGKTDNLQSEYVSEEISNIQDPTADASREGDNILSSKKVGSSEGKADNLQSESVSEEEKNTGAPSDNFLPELCPLGFNGINANEDCTQYYKCNDGIVGFIHTCPANLKFDVGRNLCISGLVDQYCHGPVLDTEEEQHPITEADRDQISNSPKRSLYPSPSPAASISRPIPPNNVWSDTYIPNEDKPGDKPRYTNWMRYDNGERAQPQIKHYHWILTVLLPNILTF